MADDANLCIQDGKCQGALCKKTVSILNKLWGTYVMIEIKLQSLKESL